MGRPGHGRAAKCECIECEVVGGSGKFGREAGETWSVWPGKENIWDLFSCSLLC